VLIDTGMMTLAPTLASRLRERTQAEIHTAVYTHGHVDHAYGLKAFMTEGQDEPAVVAHRATLARFERYEKTRMHNVIINARQFGGTAAAAEQMSQMNVFHAPPVLPNQLIDDSLEFKVGGLTFHLRHSRGETDDHVWVWCPERRVLCPGDLFIYAVPNAGNPQKVQRYPWDWAAALREMAALRPASLCPGHGGPVVNDEEKIQRMLIETADYLDSVVEQTLAAMAAGSPPHVDIVHSVTPPTTDSPWLQPVYDEAEFIVRNVIRFYGGWWSGRPSELKPASRLALAKELTDLCGGAKVLADRATKLADSGDMRLACHLADYALEAQPEDKEVQSLVEAIYTARAGKETSLMAANLFNSAAAYAASGQPYCEEATCPPENKK
jgi:glyoxylase-like metal-dependent hydrolase (beta-lactamase superfamily II)